MMKAIKTIVFAALITSCALIAMINVACAGEKLISSGIEDVVTKLDKNGAEYTRVIVQETRSLSGVSYTVGVPVMAFGDLNNVAKTLKPGQTLKAIVAENEYKGRISYNLIKILE